MVSCSNDRKSPSVQASHQAGHGHCGGQAQHGHTLGYRAEHPAAGGTVRQEKSVHTITIVVEQGETGTFGAWSPELPGCVAVADTKDECLSLMHEAVELHVAAMIEDGEALPDNKTVEVTTFTTAA